MVAFARSCPLMLDAPAAADRMAGPVGQRKYAEGAVKLNNHSGHYYKETPEWGASTSVGINAVMELQIPVHMRPLELIQ
jgi:hypothetical protein